MSVCVLFVIPDTKNKKTNDERTNELALTKFNQLLTTFGFARPYLAQNGGCQLCAWAGDAEIKAVAF